MITPACTRAIWLAVSISIIWFIFSSEMTSEPAVEFAPPESPLPAPRVTTGIEFSFAYFTAIEISAALCASKTANGAAADANGA